MKINLLTPLTKVVPGTYTTLMYQVTNGSSKIESDKLDLPSNWKILSQSKISIDATDSKYLYTLYIPKYEPSGSKIIKLSLKNATDTVSNTLSVEVEKIRAITITLINKPIMVKEADSLRLDYLIQNMGNLTEKITPASGSSKIIGNIDSLVLSPNQSYKLSTLQIIPIHKTENLWNSTSDLKIYLKDYVTPFTDLVSYQVYSGTIKKTDPYLRLPIEVGVWYNSFVANKNSNSVQLDVKGNGYLDFNQKHHISFNLHGPNSFNIPNIGSYDIYNFEYTKRNDIKLKVGDFALRFNNLMELGRFGRGFQFEKEFKKLSINTFYISPRFFPTQRETYGASVGLHMGKYATLSFNYMGKSFSINNQFRNVNLAGLSFKYQTNDINLDSEISGNLVNQKADFGAFNNFGWKIKKFYVGSNFIYTGKNFYGFFNNSWLSINNISYYINDKLSVSLNSNYTRINPNLDLLVYNSSPFYSNNFFAANYQINRKQHITVSYNLSSKEDRSSQKLFNYKENFTRLQYDFNSKYFKLSYNGQYGLTQNLLVQTDSLSKRATFLNVLQPQIIPVRWLAIGGYLEQQRTNRFSATNNLTDYWYYGGSLNVSISDKYNLSVLYRNNFALDELTQQQALLSVNANINFKNHSFSLVGGKIYLPNQISNLFTNTTYFTLKYSVRLNAPIRKNKNIGSITGQLMGVGYGTRKDGYIIQLGNRNFLTDSTGKFYFNNLIPDKYFISVKAPLENNDIITENRLPLMVNVKADSTHKVVVKLSKSGAITGYINTPEDNSAHGLSTVFVKLYNDTESFLTTPNNKGYFSFKQIKLGEYKLKVWVPGKEQEYIVDMPEQQVIIEEDKEKAYAINVRPKEKKIHFAANNFNLVVSNSTGTKSPKAITTKDMPAKTFAKLTLNKIESKSITRLGLSAKALVINTKLLDNLGSGLSYEKPKTTKESISDDTKASESNSVISVPTDDEPNLEKQDKQERKDRDTPRFRDK